MSSSLSRRRFLAGSLVFGAAVAVSACSAPQATPTSQPSASKTSPTAQPTAASGGTSTGTSATQAPGKAQSLISVNYGFIRGIFDEAYVRAAVKAGVYERAGVNLELLTFQDDVTVTRAVVTKELLGGEISFQNPLSVIEKSQPIKIIGVSYAKVPFVFLGRKEIATLKDLDGKSSGIGAINDFNHQLQLAVLRKHNLENINIDFVPIGPTPQIVQALVAGKIDAGTGLFSHEIQLKDNPDVHVLADISQELPDMPRFGPITNEEFVEKESEKLERFMLAHSQAWRWALENREAVIKSAVEDLSLPEPVAAAAYDAPLTREGMITPEFTVTEAMIDQVQELNLRAGLQMNKIPFDQAVETRFFKAVQEKLGPYKVPVKTS